MLFEEIFAIQRKVCTFVSTYKVNPLKEIGTSAPTEVLFSYLNGGIELGGLATLRVPFPFPLAAGALAKHCYQGVTRPGGRYFVSVQPLPKASFRS